MDFLPGTGFLAGQESNQWRLKGHGRKRADGHPDRLAVVDSRYRRYTRRKVSQHISEQPRINISHNDSFVSLSRMVAPEAEELFRTISSQRLSSVL